MVVHQVWNKLKSEDRVLMTGMSVYLVKAREEHMQGISVVK